MSVFYPLFLLAGLTIAIPLLIHLFNLRRYKTVLFPHSHFLKNLPLRSQKQSKLRYRRLLALRMLFLLSLVAAFAQPYFPNQNNTTTDKLQVIYLDNSASMSVKKGVRTLLDIAKEAALKQVNTAAPDSRIVILTNDKPSTYEPITKEKAIATLQKVELSALSKNDHQILQALQERLETAAMPQAQLYYYSDFQKHGFAATPDKKLLQNITFYGIPFQSESVSNVYIDTAVLAQPLLQSGVNNQLVVTSRYSGAAPKDAPILQLQINGQVKTAVALQFDEHQESIDTLQFQVAASGWQQIELSVNSTTPFDDTFRIAARSNSHLSVLVLHEQQPNPFIQAALRSYGGFQTTYHSVHDTEPWDANNLILLDGITTIPNSLAQRISKALSQGQSVALFPGRTNEYSSFSEQLNVIAPIRITGIDTTTQVATTLQPNSDLAKDIFERIPDNVQLPQANWHYTVNAGLTSNQQTVINFRNGDPLFAQFTPTRGRLYLLTTSADLQGGNFQTSYFFVPFLYQMTVQSKTGNVLATTVGSAQPTFISIPHTGERNMIHAYSSNAEAPIIPPQRVRGAGVEVFVGKVIQQPGYCSLVAASNDTTLIALNENRDESLLMYWSETELRKQWNAENIYWAGANQETITQSSSSFPLWKICVVMAVLLLIVETYLLTSNLRGSRIATTE